MSCRRALESGELRELIWRRADQSQLTFFRHHEQQILVRQEHELTVAVTSALPLARAVLQVDAREDAAIEAKGVALVNDEVVEVGLQPARCPALIDAPAGGSACDPEAADASPAHRVGSGDEDVTLGGQSRLQHTGARLPPVLPEQRAVDR